MFTGRSRRAIIVGYQNKGFENTGYNIAACSILPVGMNRDDMTLGDIVPGENFVNSTITFMTAGGATPRVTFGGKQVAQKYIYWAEDEASDGAGWYLEADEDAEENCNDVSIPFGSGFLVSRTKTETDATLLFAGEVATTPVTVGFANTGYNIVGNCSPVEISLGDITPNENFVNSTITFMTAGGATPRVTFGGKQVAQKYVYWDEDEASDGAGWYLEADEDAEENCNGVKLAPGAGFLVSRTKTETDATLTIPSPL